MGVIAGVKSVVTDEALVLKRRGQIVSAAIELFGHQGYYRTTIQEVARKAGVSAGLIYQYVNDKEDVLLLVLLRVLDLYRVEVPRALEGLTDPLERWWATVYAFCRVVDEHRVATILAYRSTKSLPHDRRTTVLQAEVETNEFIADAVRECVKAGLFRSVNVTLAVYQMLTFAHAWALKHWRLERLCTFDDYVASGFDMFSHAFFTPEGWRHYREHLADRMPRRAGEPPRPEGEARHRE